MADSCSTLQKEHLPLFTLKIYQSYCRGGQTWKVIMKSWKIAHTTLVEKKLEMESNLDWKSSCHIVMTFSTFTTYGNLQHLTYGHDILITQPVLIRSTNRILYSSRWRSETNTDIRCEPHIVVHNSKQYNNTQWSISYQGYMKGEYCIIYHKDKSTH